MLFVDCHNWQLPAYNSKFKVAHNPVSDMDKLNDLLQCLLSACGDELKLEPDQNPYVLTNNDRKEVTNVPLKGTQISTMIFPLIPNELKLQLPNRDEVEFSIPHNLGNFDFLVQKSPAGFIVSVRPGSSSDVSNGSEVEVNDEGDAEPIYGRRATDSIVVADDNSSLEFAAPQINSSGPEGIASTTSNLPSFEYDRLDTAPEYVLDSCDKIETVAANDPSFQTIFSESAEFGTPTSRESSIYDSLVEDAAASVIEETPSISREMKMDELFIEMDRVGASDLHLSVSVPPMVRKDGKMKPLREGDAVLTPASIKSLLTSIMPEKNRDEFDVRHDTDFAYEIPDVARFRCNVFMDRKGMGGVFRIIPTKILTAEQLGLSQAIMNLCELSKGLVVVTGPTGSGKSTTLCAMVDAINKNREDHIITIEDPIEFVHDNQKCLVNQREVHNHTDSFKDALRAALREDPDILLVGEMRDLETISIAIETAETGHLVFGTLHTTTAASTVDRIIDQFPADRQQQIRVMLSESLKGVIAQTLLPKKGGGRVAALEVLIVTPAISNLIREGKTFQIPSAMQTGKNHGMVMLNDALFEHVKNGLVEPRDAYIKAVDKTGFETLLERGGFKL